MKIRTFYSGVIVFFLSLLLVPSISIAEDMKQPITIVIAPFENAADNRVFELLDKKIRLFDGRGSAEDAG